MKHFDGRRSDDSAGKKRERERARERRVNVDLMLQIGDFGNKGETV